MAIDKAAKAGIKVIDKFAGNLFGGDLIKARFVVFEKPDFAKEIKGGVIKSPIEFFINPSSISVSKEAILAKDAANQTTTENKYATTEPICMTLPELWFDTYDTRTSVRTQYIEQLEALVDYNEDTHYLPVVVFEWGQFSGKSDNAPVYTFHVTKLDVEYTMFLPDATPVRAKVKVGLEQVITNEILYKKNGKNSPDHAKLYTVKRGDTLQGIAMAEYDDPREWRRIAKSNNISNPMDVAPGTKLLVPPILK